jgi:hypothetical protein
MSPKSPGPSLRSLATYAVDLTSHDESRHRSRRMKREAGPHRRILAWRVIRTHLCFRIPFPTRTTACLRSASGGFGVSLALIAFVGLIASFWVWIAAVVGVYWERKAGPAVVAEMEELSAGISTS